MDYNGYCSDGCVRRSKQSGDYAKNKKADQRGCLIILIIVGFLIWRFPSPKLGSRETGNTKNAVTSGSLVQDPEVGIRSKTSTVLPIDNQAPAPVTKPMSAALTDAEPHRIFGLHYGDYLSVRSGPGTKYSVVAKLKNDDIILVFGQPVQNGLEFWVQCLLDKTGTDSSTATTGHAKQDGWVNRDFLRWVGKE
jgi:hypothetical protein